MNKKNFTTIVIISALIALMLFKFNSATNEHLFKGAKLPGQIGSIVKSSKYINNSKKQGFLTYGPYIELPSGTYLFDISYSSTDADGSKFDIVTNKGKEIVANGNLELNNSNGHILETIEIDKKQTWEVRIWYGAKGELSLHSINITKQFGSIDIQKYFKYFLLLLLLNIIIFYAYRFSKKITLITLLLFLLVIFTYVLEAYTNYYNYKELTYKNMPLTKDIFKYYFEQTLKSEQIKLTSPELKKDKNIDSFYIMIDQKNLDILNADLPSSGLEHYVNARLKINNEKSTKVKLRYRGGSTWNWRYDRKSIKIKFKGNTSYNMMKKINLSVLYSQDMFIEPVTQKIAAEVGALAPKVKTVKMFVNGEYIGLYLYLDQIDESFLRKNRLMPGSIYNGDYSLKKKFSDYIGSDGIAKLWFDSKVWEKKAARNAEQKNITEDIELLIQAVNQYNDEEFFNFADTYLSDQYYTYLALDVLWGTHHHDYYHNHKIYFDPYKGKYTAISWDIRFWRANKIKDNSYYPLIQRIALNPLLELKRDKELYRILKTVNIEYISDVMEQEKEKIMSSYLADKKRKKIAIDQKLFPWKETLNLPQLQAATQKDMNNLFEQYSNNLKSRLNYVRDMLDDVTVKYSIKKEDNISKVLFQVNGNSAVRIRYENIMLYPGREVVNPNALNLDIAQYGKTQVKNKVKTYILTIPKDSFDEKLFQSGINAVTGKTVVFKQVDNLDSSNATILTPKIPIFKKRILSGTIKVKKTLVFDKYTNVIIEPNTTFIMDKNCSIYFYAKVTAIGTKQKPIKFIAKDKTKPWGLVAVQGKATTGSKFHFCHFENGSIDTRNLIHYTSQFNIHDMDDFEVKNCFIGKNYKGDDAMHIAYAKGVVDSCIFDGARSDGLDIDISDVNITNNIFKNSGNDGLDVMTTTMNASNNTFTDTGDKGISVGEWSTATITDSTFIRTVIGLEIKDKSKVIASHLKFIDSKDKAINLYNKNKRYNTGGFLKATNITFVGNNTVKADKKSKITINE